MTENITFRITKNTKEKLTAIAYSLDCKWGDKGSINKMLEQIANNELVVIKKISLLP
jgi:hypothetical protein